MKKNIIYKLGLIAVLLFTVSCKNQITKESKNDLINQISDKEQIKYIKHSLEKKDSITSSENLEEIYYKYKKIDTTYWIEGAEFLNSKEKVIFYSSSFRDEEKIRNSKQYTILVNNQGKVNLVSYEENRGRGKNRKLLTSDTLFFKNQKLHFWKNKQVKKESFLEKEKELLKIKKEIDSILNE